MKEKSDIRNPPIGIMISTKNNFGTLSLISCNESLKKNSNNTPKTKAASVARPAAIGFV